MANTLLSITTGNKDDSRGNNDFSQKRKYYECEEKIVVITTAFLLTLVLCSVASVSENIPINDDNDKQTGRLVPNAPVYIA